MLNMLRFGFEGGVKIFVTMEFNLSVSSIIIFKNFSE